MDLDDAEGMVLSPGDRISDHHGEGLFPTRCRDIDSETHAALKKILNDEKRRITGSTTSVITSSGGVLKCWRCGAGLVARPTGEAIVCLPAPVPQPGPDGCRKQLRIIAEPLEVRREISDGALPESALAQAPLTKVTLRLTIRPTCDNKRRSRSPPRQRGRLLVERSSIVTPPQTKNKLRPTARGRDQDQRRIRPAVPGDSDREELKAAYENGNHEWRRAFIESLVDHVVAGPASEVSTNDPRRIKIVIALDQQTLDHKSLPKSPLDA